jgi:thiamine biosynthesis lipoprotein ApbE
MRDQQISAHAISTSAITGTAFDAFGRQHHLFDPKPGRPGHGLVSASVVARRAADTDLCSTALLATHRRLAFESTLPMGIEQIFTVDNRGTALNWKAGKSHDLQAHA